MDVKEEKQIIAENSVLTEEERKYLPFAWRLLTRDDKEQLSTRSLGRILRGFGKNPSEQEVQFLIFDNKLHEDSVISYEEAVPLYAKCKSEVINVNDLMTAFKVFDPNQTGKITVDDLKDILTRLGEVMTNYEFEQFCTKADRDETGIIGYEGFCKILMGDNRPAP